MKSIMLLSAIIGTGLFLVNCTQSETASDTTGAGIEQEMLPETQIARGKYLVTIIGCGDCHTPKMMTPAGPAPDMSRFLSGHPASEQLPPIPDKEVVQGYALFNLSLTAAVGPWGTTYATNLTPDETGLGTWSLEQFEKAMKQGKEKGLDNARTLMPPMPWQNFSAMNSEDIAAIFAYLKTLSPVKNVVPVYTPPAR